MAQPRQRLIKRREELGLTRAQVAEALHFDLTAYAKIEQGKTAKMRVGRRPALARVLKWSPTQLALALDGFEPVVDVPNGHSVPSWLTGLGRVEQAAARICAFEPVVVHGLLQTADYATAVESVGGYSEWNLAEKVRMRLTRQAVLTREPDPVVLWVILDQSVLLRPVGTDAVMAAQLEHLAQQAELPNITIQVMPFSSAVFPAAFGAFSLFTDPGADEPYTAVTEDAAGPHYIDRPHDLAPHVELFGHLSTHALPAMASVDLIRRTMKENYL
jgi:transcriptional regulator with XRE-family HTH domain